MTKKPIVNRESEAIDLSLSVDTYHAAKLLGCSESLLRKFRSEGTGPAYSKLGKKIVYPIWELRKHLETNLVK